MKKTTQNTIHFLWNYGREKMAVERERVVGVWELSNADGVYIEKQRRLKMTKRKN